MSERYTPRLFEVPQDLKNLPTANEVDPCLTANTEDMGYKPGEVTHDPSGEIIPIDPIKILRRNEFKEDPMFKLEFSEGVEEAVGKLFEYEQEYYKLLEQMKNRPSDAKFDSEEFEIPYRIKELEELFKELRNRQINHLALDRLKERKII